MLVNDNLPGIIKKHIIKYSELAEIKSIEDQWSNKYKIYLDMVEINSMDIVTHLGIKDKRGLLLFTYSGSILLISPDTKKGRWLEYCGLDSRKDTPHFLSEHKIQILNDISVGEIVYFNAPFIRNTSPIYKIAVTKSIKSTIFFNR